jgi:biopolymer transport protein ExbB
MNLLAAAPVSIPGATVPLDLTPWGMFVGADIVVKLVIIGLVVASVVTWTIYFAKSAELRAAKRQVREARAAADGAVSTSDASVRLSSMRGAPAALAAAVAEERTASSAAGATDKDGVKERAVSRLDRIEADANRRMTAGVGVLGTISNTAPFVGLFGTVWGIMNAFIGISESQTTNLAVVAPGIAEALLATALGLVAAIPAAVIYNHFARAVGGWRAGLTDFSASLLRLLSRELDADGATRR